MRRIEIVSVIYVFRAGKKIFCAEVPVDAREGRTGKRLKSQRDAGENLVSEPADEAQKTAEEIAGGQINGVRIGANGRYR